jgi:hypothetical protein
MNTDQVYENNMVVFHITHLTTLQLSINILTTIHPMSYLLLHNVHVIFDVTGISVNVFPEATNEKNM